MMDSATNVVEWAMQQFINQVTQVAQLQMSPHVLLKPQLYIDGDKWCALYGENIQNGVAGFGKSPADAMYDFDSNWKKEILADLKSNTKVKEV